MLHFNLELRQLDKLEVSFALLGLVKQLVSLMDAVEMAGKGVLVLVGAIVAIGVVSPSKLVVSRLDYLRRAITVKAKRKVRVGWDRPGFVRLHQSGDSVAGLVLQEGVAVGNDGDIFNEQTRVLLLRRPEHIHTGAPHAAIRARRHHKRA
jgi:hypothetical protein